MESPHLNFSSSEDDALAALLQKSIAPLRDDGFSARVMVALPSSRWLSGEWRRWGLGAVGALAGLGVAWPTAVSQADLAREAQKLAESLTNLISTLTNPMLTAAVTVAALSLLLVFLGNPRDRRFL